MKEEQLSHFINRLMSIGGSTFTLMGTRRPGVSGSGASEFGASSSDVSDQLKRNAINFAEAYRNPSTDVASLRAAADKVEGSLFVEQTLSTISESDLEGLVDELHNLTAAHTS